MKSTILVTGATGAVGPRVVRALHDAGYGVRTLSLDAPARAAFPEGVEVLMGDVTEPSAVRAAAQGVEGVIHLAALLHIVNPPPALRARYERINVGGTATVVEAAARAGVQRLVIFSTIAVYGSSAGQMLIEDSPAYPDSYYAETKLAAERIVLDGMRAGGRPLGTVLRLGAVYGAHIKGNYQRLLTSLARHRFVPLGDGRNRRTLVYESDVARAAVLALQHPAAAGRVYNVSDGQPHLLREVIAAMCQALGRKPPRLSLPVRPMRWIAGAIEDSALAAGLHSPVVRATVDKYTEDVAVDSRRIADELGFVPLFDLATGWREAVQEMRQMGIL